MKIRGKSDLKRPSAVIKLDCGEEITVLAPALGAPFRALEVVPPPAPPKRLVRQKGSPPQYLADETDPGFQAAEARANQLQLVYLAWEALKDVPPEDGVSFETKPQGEPDRAFVERLQAEFQRGPFTQGDLVAIGKFVGKTSGGTGEEVEEAEGFSGGPGPDEEG